MQESKMIAEKIWMLEHGQYSERKEYIRDYFGNGVTFDGYTYKHDNFATVVWKHTNIGEHPEYKGDSLSKVVPYTAHKGQMVAILDNQNWIYW